MFVFVFVPPLRRGYSDKFAELPVLAQLYKESAHNLPCLLEELSTYTNITASFDLAPCLYCTTGIYYPIHKIADGAIPTSRT